MDLHRFFNHVKKSSIIVTWNERLNILYELIMGIATIHSHGLVHQDLHPGNILYQQHVAKNVLSFEKHYYTNNGKASITDFGLCRTVDKHSNNTKIYGVLPYIAPEILMGKPFTKASDIYSLGSLMYKLGTGYTPFYDMPYDYHLCMRIIKGERPPPIDGAPEFYEKLMRRCWDENPENRLTIEEIEEIVKTWVNSPNEPSEEIKKEIEKAENFLKSRPSTEISDFNLETNITYQLYFNDRKFSKVLPTIEIEFDMSRLDNLINEMKEELEQNNSSNRNSS
ncbi:kinase-like domain-containing protein [Glomus cerebriforme]|uniref:Kinase-like domain-containing protein n=1 Tax=Glomus cerebriforme TaxID=658196 RepID=A0A397SHH9_9GLOM|nr:kinase-like domain-containing protein [Glomus cerebriforme]